MKKYVFVFILFFLIIKVHGQEVWFKNVAENANNFLILNSDSLFIEYDCEIGEFRWGLYEMENDTLYLHVKYKQYDDKIEPLTYICLKKENEINFLYREDSIGDLKKIKEYIMEKGSEDKLNIVEKWKLKLAKDEIKKQNIKDISL